MVDGMSVQEDTMTYAVIVCMGRTGSTLLVHLLDSHPEIEFRGELFLPQGDFEQRTDTTRRDYLRSGAYRTTARVRGFKMPFEWILKFPGVFEDFRALGYKVLLLHRTNYLSQLVSAKLAASAVDYSSLRAYPEQSIIIDKWELAHFFGIAHYLNGHVLPNLAQGMETHVVRYEDLHDKATQQALLDFLGVERQPLTTPTIKARTNPLSEVVANYGELKLFFSDSPVKYLFDDPRAI
jgi:hypothetical protein